MTLARACTDTFSGIHPVDVPGFVLAQALGAAAATGLFRWLQPRALQAAAPDVRLPPKSWDEFRDVRFDFVITVCDSARESCPVWPGQPIVALWGVDDPAAFVGTPEAKETFFYEVAYTLYRRLQMFTSLPLEKLDRLRVEQLTRDIGRDKAPESKSGA